MEISFYAIFYMLKTTTKQSIEMKSCLGHMINKLPIKTQQLTINS